MSVSLFCELSVRPEHIEAFLPLMERHATTCRHEESGCTIFAVGRDRDDPNLIRIYEQYEQDSDLEAHRLTDRYAAFNEAIDPMVSNVVVHTVDLPW